MTSTPTPPPEPSPSPAPAAGTPAGPSGVTGAIPQRGFMPRREAPIRLNPKKVRAGIKIVEGPAGAVPWASSWAAQRWVRLVELVASGSNLVEGLAYAKAGQTKSLAVDAGSISAVVQGRLDRPYQVSIAVTPLSAEQWHVVVKAMAEGAVYSAKLLSGELPPNIEDVFGPLSLKLFPTEGADVTVNCSCKRAWASLPGAVGNVAEEALPVSDFDSTSGDASIASAEDPSASADRLKPESDSPWCKHACCAAYIFADRLSSDPFLMFRLRGLAGAELMDQLAHMRASSQGTGLYVGRVAGVSDVRAPLVDEMLERFWEPPVELSTLDIRVSPPPVAHPLLRRLGPSPFTNSTFPLVGLLASCYDTISADVLKRFESKAEAPATDEPEPEPEPDDQ